MENALPKSMKIISIASIILFLITYHLDNSIPNEKVDTTSYYTKG